MIVGLPLTLGGQHGEQAEAARAFAERLDRRLKVPVELHDERLTTRLAERTGGAGDEDSRAAAHLLESYLAAVAKHPARPGAQAPPSTAGQRG